VWKDLRSEKRDFSKPLTLAELTDMALANHPASRKAWHEARIAAERVTVAEGYFMPELQATAVGGIQKTAAKPEGFDSDYVKYGPGIQLNYMIINFGGGRAAAVEQALQTVNAADFAFNRVLQDVLLSVETAYYAVVSAAAGIDAAAAAVKDAEKTLEVADARLKQGVGTEFDVLQARTGVDQALYNQAGAKGLLRIAGGNLAQAIGSPADTDIKVAQPVAAVPGGIIEKDIGKLIDNALGRRPDIAALRSMLAADEAAVKVSAAACWPSLFLNGSLSQTSYDVNGGREMQDSDLSYNGFLSLQWTVFDGFQNTSRKRIAIAQAEAARAQLRQAELAASADVWARYNNYQTALEKHTFSKAYLESATAAHRLAMDSYRAQLIGITDLLNAETQLARARTQAVSAMQEVFTALAGLAHSAGLLGRGGPGAAEWVQP
jgi:outer membrane protein TolC